MKRPNIRLGKVLGLGDAPKVEPESDGAAEDGPRSFHRSGCSVHIPEGATFLSLHRPAMAAAFEIAECQRESEPQPDWAADGQQGEAL